MCGGNQSLKGNPLSPPLGEFAASPCLLGPVQAVTMTTRYWSCWLLWRRLEPPTPPTHAHKYKHFDTLYATTVSTSIILTNDGFYTAKNIIVFCVCVCVCASLKNIIVLYTYQNKTRVIYILCLRVSRSALRALALVLVLPLPRIVFPTNQRFCGCKKRIRRHYVRNTQAV